jgi:hypothetical protein
LISGQTAVVYPEQAVRQVLTAPARTIYLHSVNILLTFLSDAKNDFIMFASGSWQLDLEKVLMSDQIFH